MKRAVLRLLNGYTVVSGEPFGVESSIVRRLGKQRGECQEYSKGFGAATPGR